MTEKERIEAKDAIITKLTIDNLRKDKEIELLTALVNQYEKNQITIINQQNK